MHALWYKAVRLASQFQLHWIENFVVAVAVVDVDVLILLTCLRFWSENFNPRAIFCHYFGDIFDLKGFSAFLRCWRRKNQIWSKPLLEIVLTPQVWLSGKKIIKMYFWTLRKKAKSSSVGQAEFSDFVTTLKLVQILKNKTPG